jgi:hypothetical protein
MLLFLKIIIEICVSNLHSVGMKIGLVVNLRMGQVKKIKLMMDLLEWTQMVSLNQTGKR